MSYSKRFKPALGTKLAILLLCLIAGAEATLVKSQGQESLADLKKRVAVLIEQTKYTEAAPLLEKIVAAEPNDPENHYYLGSALLGLSANTKDETAQRNLRKRARAEFIKAKELGSNFTNLDAMIQAIPADGGATPDFSNNAKAAELMKEGEAAYSRGDMDEAFKLYQKALALDPTLYYAALFSGDVMMQKNDFAQAETWYKRAIEIDPMKETAYRYSATPLMKQQKFDEAFLRYVEAFITEPYNRFTTAGLLQWAQVTNKTLAHPRIDVPTNVKFDEKGNAKIDLDAGALMGDKDDGSIAWIAYGTTRSLWRKEKFSKTYPKETEYRHSLAEEADALRSVLTVAAETRSTSSNKTPQLSPSLQILKKLDEAGLLEAYILLARVDNGIALDHPEYLKSNRDKLRRYVMDYVAKGGGN
ncbi:MAG TPA: tetratricopeptide repeat protein [Pyrinomonadaceae bacterium]|jgi:tetratricopeptide (TPR) repeat protein|nr:tetratricopeptide repeat protein [Pyrinomonadaceae bacterium]